MLQPHQCGLPADDMALRLFRPLLLRRLRDLGHPPEECEALLRRMPPPVRELLRELMREHPVLIAAPPVREIGRLQAFEPVPVAGRAVRVHPLACGTFGDKGSGSAVVVYLALSLGARAEAAPMAAPGPLFRRADGAFALAPSRDAALGCAYLTAAPEVPRPPGEVPAFFGPEEVLAAHAHGRVGVHARISVRLPLERKVVAEGKDEWGRVRLEEIPRDRNGRVRTTAGRVLFNDALGPGSPFYDLPMTRESLRRVAADAHRRLGGRGAIDLLARVEAVGAGWATRAGLSLAAADLRLAPGKEATLRRADEEVAKQCVLYDRGLVTDQERCGRVIDAWSNAAAEIRSQAIRGLRAWLRGETPALNPLLLMTDFANGWVEEIRRLAGMWGLTATPLGRIVELPIRANLREGLGVTEYFLTTLSVGQLAHNARRWRRAADRLTRRLVAAAQGVVVTTHDCGTARGVIKGTLLPGDFDERPLAAGIRGRVSCADIRNPYTGEVVVPAGGLISAEVAGCLESLGLGKVVVRSPLTCEAPRGVCRLCYGADPATGEMVEEGAAVGVTAALALGDLGAGLTGRTILWGSRGEAPPVREAKARTSGEVRYAGLRHGIDEEGTRIVLTAGAIETLDWRDRQQERFQVPVGAQLLVEDGQSVAPGAVLARWDPYHRPIVAGHAGRVRFVDLVEGRTLRTGRDPGTDSERREVVPERGLLDPRLRVEGEHGEPLAIYPVTAQAALAVRDGQAVLPGTVLARVCRETVTRHWVGGWARVAELFEARRPGQPATLARCSGLVRLGDMTPGGRSVYVRPTDEAGEPRPDANEVEHRVTPSTHPRVQTGVRVTAGERLADGELDPHEVLEVLGAEAVQDYLIEQLQAVYRVHRFEVDDKHIEVVLARMLGEPGRLRGVTELAQSGNPLCAGGLVPTLRALAAAARDGRTAAIERPHDHILLRRLVPIGTGFRGG